MACLSWHRNTWLACLGIALHVMASHFIVSHCATWHGWNDSQLLQGSSDVVVLRYCYYFLARILTESAAAGSYNEGGGVPTPNWDTLADVSADGSQAATRAELLSLILSRLATEASTPDVAAHARRMAALKALACAPMAHQDAYAALVRIILAILDSVSCSPALAAI
ncbi:unnamed protein product [Closterium sp. NIES-53]